MIKSFVTKSLIACAAALALAIPQKAQAIAVTLDDFNVNNGHFTSNPATGSGSSSTIDPSSTVTRVTTNGPVEGAGHQQLFLVPKPASVGASIRLRHLSGGGSPANNTAFTTTAGATNGWLGVYIKADPTNSPTWTVQIWIEGASNNGSVTKTIICDGTYHLYEWDLDDTTGGLDGWGDVAGIVTGSPTVAAGSHTIDSILFRNVNGPAASTLYMDFVAKSASGSVSNMLSNPCLSTSGVLVTGPVSTNSNQVTVTSVSGTATKITVYQNTGAGPVAIGTKTTGITAGNNNVTVAGMIKNAIVTATQTVAGQEGCPPASGITAGGGANPSIRAALSIRETSNTGPIGSPATDLASGNIHFLGASTVSGGAPIDAPIIFPSNQWQTISFLAGSEIIADSANAAGTTADGAGYAPNDAVSLQVYAFRTYTNGVKIYSAVAAESAGVSSNDVFQVNWTWDAVAGAQGYRLLQNINGLGYSNFVDVVSNTYHDANTGWAVGSTVTPTSTPTANPSIQWNPTVGNPNHIGTPWGILEAIAFAINVPDGTGPFDIYIDNLKNGSTIFQDFEGALAGAQDYGFRAPSFSGTTSGSILATPSFGGVANSAADTGTKSLHLQYQWSGTNAAKWLRLTTSGVGNPLVDLSQPISFRLLLLPIGTNAVAPAGPTLTIAKSGTDVVLNWTGTHRLLEATNVVGPYTTNVPTTGPVTVTPVGQKFYRLKD